MRDLDSIFARIDAMTPEEVNEMFKRALEESGIPYVEGGKAFEYEDLFPDFENLPTLEEYIEWREKQI